MRSYVSPGTLRAPKHMERHMAWMEGMTGSMIVSQRTCRSPNHTFTIGRMAWYDSHARGFSGDFEFTETHGE